MAENPQIHTRLPAEMRAQIDAQLTHRRQRTGANTTISEWLREAAAEKLARDLPTNEEPAAPASTGT
jgi:hypothetical protein